MQTKPRWLTNIDIRQFGFRSAVLAVLLLGVPCAPSRSAMVKEALLTDFSGVVTTVDLGFNDFSGNLGAINSSGANYGVASLRTNPAPLALRFQWDFTRGTDPTAYTGLFFSLFGLTDTWATFDGVTTTKVAFAEHSLNLDQIDGQLAEPGGPRRFHRLTIALRYQGKQPLTLRVELKDAQDHGRFTRFHVRSANGNQVLTWDFRNPQQFHALDQGDLDLTQAKVLSLVIERWHVADGVSNPATGLLDVQRLAFVPNRSATEPGTISGLLDLLERRAFQYFLDWTSRKPASLGIPQDRSTSGDLLTVGGIGFALPAWIIGSERGWITRSNAAAQTKAVLTLLADANGFGPEAIGRLGHHGWFYHFLGVDGRRKLNFDFPASAANEALNTVELSAIDTGLALMGVLAAQSYFTGTNADETAIRTLAQTIYDRVDWLFMLEPGSQRFYLAWKPNEARDATPPFAIPDTAGEGAYSGHPGSPGVLDYYTDEQLILLLLSLGSTAHPVPVDVRCAGLWAADANGLIRSYPGTLFTYQFLRAFLDTRQLTFAQYAGAKSVNWYTNSVKAINGVISYATQNHRRYATYNANAWGLSAAEGPDDRYQAFGALPVAVSTNTEENGTVTYYGMLSSVSFGNTLKTRAVAALRQAWQRGHWHYRFALPDAFHDNLSQAALQTATGTDNALLRHTGRWTQRALFAIDQGPMLLHLENTRSGLLWQLLAANPNLQRALARLQLNTPLMLEAEQGTGAGQIKTRTLASGGTTVLLQAGESRTLTAPIPATARYQLWVRYSNDNFGPLETVTVTVDGTALGQFQAQDTGDNGTGWNIFRLADVLGPIQLTAGTHQIQLTVTGGDGSGVEIDRITLEQLP